MRVSRSQAAESRQTVINVASRLFREHGFDGMGLKDLMKGAWLTQGAFYKPFASKGDLARRRPGGRWRAPPVGGQRQPRPIRRIRWAR